MSRRAKDIVAIVGALVVWVIWFSYNVAQTRLAVETGYTAPRVAPEEQIASWIGSAVAPTFLVGLLLLVYFKWGRRSPAASATGESAEEDRAERP